MITLYGFGAGFGLPELSPFVTKTEVQLQLAGLAYRKLPAMPTDSPKGQLPFIDDDGEVVADSTFIRAHIERKYGVDLDEGLTAGERAGGWAVERMLENHFGATMGYCRWLIPENFAKGPALFVRGVPETDLPALRADLLDRVTIGLRSQGPARHTRDEVVDLGAKSLSALSIFIADKPYLMGDRPCGVDATAFAMLAGLLTPFFDSALRERAGGYGNLVAYTDRMMARFFPDFPWGVTAAKSAEMA
jgi:glutathione S-transferase